MTTRVGWGRALLWGGTLWLASRVFITSIAFLTQYLRPDNGLIGSSSSWLFRVLFHWDSSYFRGIALHGYFSDNSASSWPAFFPGYPLAARGVALAIDPSGPGAQAVAIGMWIVPLVASLAAAVLLFRLADARLSGTGAIKATALFVFWPYALFLVASYSEALFLAFAIGAWLCGTRDRWLAAGLLAAAASVTRPNGVFLAAALLVMYLVRQRSSGRPVVTWKLGAVAIGFSGAVAYFVYLFSVTGSFLVWTRSQAEWNRSLEWPWVTLVQTAGRMLYASSLDRKIQFGLDLVFAALLVAAIIYFVRTRRWPEVTYLALTAVSLMTSLSYVSLARNTITLFPIVIALAGVLQPPGRRRLYWVVLAVSALVLAFNTRQFALGLWAD